MKFKNASARAHVRALVLAAFALAVMVAPALAQEEGVPVVLDEPVVQVNDNVIMLSQLRRENREFKEVLMKQRGFTEQQAEEEIAKKQPEIIVNLINEALILQKGKDLPRVSEDVEAEVNREILRVARSQGFKTLEELEQAMTAENLKLSEIRDTLRTQYMRQAVLQREVDAKIYFSLTPEELKKFYNEHRDKFQSVTLSEIFLSLAGRSETEVLAKARQIVAQARGGSDFGALAVANSEREQNGVRLAEKTKGLIAGEDNKPKWFLLSELNGELAKSIKDLKAGGVSEPIKVDEGYIILRVNERDDAYNEQQVRGALMQERAEKERESYVRTLRQEAYIKAAENYKDVVQPLLDRDAPATASKQGTGKNDKDKNKKSN